MGLFSAIVSTAIETVKLPVSVIQDAATLGGVLNEHGSYTVEQLEKIKEAADKAGD